MLRKKIVTHNKQEIASAQEAAAWAAHCLTFDHLSAGYQKNIVVDDVSLHIAPGKMTILVGANGCGKSTLLNTLARMLNPLAGQVMLNGQPIHQQPTKQVARQLGILPQSPLVPEGLTVMELVARGRFPWQGILHQWSDDDERAVARALALTGTEALACQPLESLSGGQRQRCWIAMVLAQETPIILLDEPTTFLDLRYQVELLELLRELTQRHGRTVVMVLHDLNFALHYGDVLVMMKQGKIEHVLEDPQACSAQLVHHVFDIAMQKFCHPLTGKPFFIPFPAQSSEVIR
jgi:iron complex transport system ATP-binding protein